MSVVSAPRLPPATPLTWVTWREALTVVTYPRHLKKTVLIALFVGTVLFCINQLDVVLRGDATTTVWVKAAVTYLVPFCVSNAGVLVASHRTLSAGDDPTSPESDRQPGAPSGSHRVPLHRRRRPGPIH